MSNKKVSSLKKRMVSHAQPGGFAPLSSLFEDFELEDKGGYITQEFQDFGYRLASELDDLTHKSLYIKLAKDLPRGWLEEALSFVADAQNVKSKGKLFMWKLGQLQRLATQHKKQAA